MNEKQPALLKNTRILTLIIAIIYTLRSIGSVFISAGLLLTRNADLNLIEDFSQEEIAILGNAVSPSSLYLTLFLTAVYVALTILLYRSRSKLGKENIVSKWPYLLVVLMEGYTVIGNLINSEAPDVTGMILSAGIMALSLIIFSNISKLNRQS